MIRCLRPVLIDPSGQLDEVFQWQFFNRAFNLFNSYHAVKVTEQAESDKALSEPFFLQG
jgi:hypothetical protein